MNSTDKPLVVFEDLGLIRYAEAWEYQQQLLQEVIQRKRANRDLPPAQQQQQYSHLLLCQHPPVYTLGRSGALEHLLLDEEQLQEKGIDFFKINRGGDITYHGPNQVVGYPIFDLDCFFTDVHKYVRCLEEVIIRTLGEYDIEAYRIKDYTGVWLPATSILPQRKICAIGVHLSRWVTMHGFALNVNTDLEYFGHIIPCGIQEADKAVTSLQLELGRAIDLKEISEKIKTHFLELFGFEWFSA